MGAPDCPLCRKNDSEPVFSDKGYAVRRCHVCGLFFIDPYPSDQDEHHDRVTEYRYDELEVVGTRDQYRGESQYYKRYFPLIAEEAAGAEAALDVGCGTGHLLELLGRRGNRYRVGIELNAARAKEARRHAGCDIVQVPIEAFQSERKFDLITMINVLSHIPDFDALFRSIRSLLSDRGKFVLKVGELADDVRKGDFFDWGIPDHLHFLGLRTIDFAADRYGFRVARHERIPFSADLFARTRWLMPGRSRLRNAVKRIVAWTPLALPILAKAYDRRHGGRVFSSFIVLVPA